MMIGTFRGTRFLMWLSLVVAGGSLLMIPSPALAGSRDKNVVKAIIGGVVAYGVYQAMKSSQHKKRKHRGKRVLWSKKRVIRPKKRVLRTKRALSRSPHVQDSRRRSVGVARLSVARVKRIQTSLAALGLYNMAIDGKSGPGTRSAIRQYQEEFGYQPTGRLSEGQFAVLTSMTEPGADSSHQYAQESGETTDQLSAKGIPTALVETPQGDVSKNITRANASATPSGAAVSD